MPFEDQSILRKFDRDETNQEDNGVSEQWFAGELIEPTYQVMWKIDDDPSRFMIVSGQSLEELNERLAVAGPNGDGWQLLTMARVRELRGRD